MINDVIKESWAFQDMIQIGREQGLQAQRQSVILLIEEYFPNLIQLAQDVCNTMQTLEELQDLFQRILRSRSEQEVRQILLSAQK
jgi:hypothetical protein